MRSNNSIVSSVFCLALAVVGSGASGCATMADAQRVSGTRKYQPLSATATSSSSERWYALQAVLELDGWKVVLTNESRHEIVAVHTKENPELRDHVIVQIADGETVVAMRTEMHASSGWEHSDLVCGSYGYARERSMSDLIEQVAVTASRGGGDHSSVAQSLRAAR